MGFNALCNNTLFLFKSMKRNFQSFWCDWFPLCSFENNIFIFVNYFNILALVWQVWQRNCGSWNYLFTKWKCQQVLMAKLLIFSLSLTMDTVVVPESIPSLSSSWEWKPQDGNLGVAIELTRSFKVRNAIVVWFSWHWLLILDSS